MLGPIAAKMMTIAATTAAVGTADPEPSTKVVILTAAATTAACAVITEGVSRLFKWAFND
jgi:hypothetical protein